MALNAPRGPAAAARAPAGGRRVARVPIPTQAWGSASSSARRASASGDHRQQQHEQQAVTAPAAPAAPASAPAASLTTATTVGRRPLFAAAAAALAAAALPSPARAFAPPPDGYALHLDRLDGYSFLYPRAWQQVTTSGNDVFFRNVRSAAENMFVDITSPSSSRFASVDDLGSPEDAAARLLDTFLNREFMSTRLGVRREGEVLSATRRLGPADPVTGEPRAYLDVDVRLRSFASRSPYVVSSAEMLSDFGVEWDRRLMTTLGVANKRLYSLRMQTDYAAPGGSAAAPSAGAGAPASTPVAVFDLVRGSFGVREVEEK